MDTTPDSNLGTNKSYLAMIDAIARYMCELESDTEHDPTTTDEDRLVLEEVDAEFIGDRLLSEDDVLIEVAKRVREHVASIRDARLKM